MQARYLLVARNVRTDLLYRVYTVHTDGTWCAGIFLDTNQTYKPTLCGGLDAAIYFSDNKIIPKDARNYTNRQCCICKHIRTLVARHQIGYFPVLIDCLLKKIELDQLPSELKVFKELILNTAEALIMMQDDIEKEVPMHIMI